MKCGATDVVPTTEVKTLIEERERLTFGEIVRFVGVDERFDLRGDETTDRRVAPRSQDLRFPDRLTIQADGDVLLHCAGRVARTTPFPFSRAGLGARRLRGRRKPRNRDVDAASKSLPPLTRKRRKTRSNQKKATITRLGILERAAGIEPATLAWKARALPLCNAREIAIAGGQGRIRTCVALSRVGFTVRCL